MGETLGRIGEELKPGRIQLAPQGAEANVPSALSGLVGPSAGPGAAPTQPDISTPPSRPTFLTSFLANLGPALAFGLQASGPRGEKNFATGLAGGLQGITAAEQMAFEHHVATTRAEAATQTAEAAQARAEAAQTRAEGAAKLSASQAELNEARAALAEVQAKAGGFRPPATMDLPGELARTTEQLSNLAPNDPARPLLEKHRDAINAALQAKKGPGSIDQQLLTAFLGGKPVTPDNLKQATSFIENIRSAPGERRALVFAKYRSVVQTFDPATNELGFANPFDIITGKAGKVVPTQAGMKTLQNVGIIENIQDAADEVRKTIGVLNTSPARRAQIGAAIAGYRGPIGDFASSGAAQGLSEGERAYATATLRLQENGLGLRGLLGAGQASDERIRFIERTLVGLRTPDPAFAIRQLDILDRELSKTRQFFPRGIVPNPPGAAPVRGGTPATPSAVPGNKPVIKVVL